MSSRSRNKKRAMRRPLETFFFQVGAVCIPVLPRCFILGLSKLAGHLTYCFGSRERTVGMANLNTVFGDTKTHAEKIKILIRSLAGFSQTMLDIFWFSKNTQKRVEKYQQFIPDNGPYFEDRGQVIITAHIGNWELMGLAGGLHDNDVACVAAVTKNPDVDKHLNELRQRTGQTIIPREGAMRTMIARLRKNGKLAFVLDQNTSEADGGIWVNFLGMPTPVSSAPAYLAYRTGTEIIFAFSRPIGGGKYEAFTGLPMQPPPFNKDNDHEAIVKELTQQMLNIVSDEIRNHPESWLWSYKHWRKVAPGDNPDRYPDYS